MSRRHFEPAVVVPVLRRAVAPDVRILRALPPPLTPARIKAARRKEARLRRMPVTVATRSRSHECPTCGAVVEVPDDALAAAVFVGAPTVDAAGKPAEAMTRADIWAAIRAGACGCAGRL